MVRSRHSTRPSAGFKRKRSGNASRPFKRRRVVRARRSNNFTSQAGSGGGIRFRSRKVSRSTWRRMLWNNTLQKDHYRSLSSTSSTFNTPATISTMATSAVPALRFGTDSFYVAAGGARNPDAAQSLPVFTGKFVIRGGTIGCRLVNTFDTTGGSQNTLQGMIYLVKTPRSYNSGSIPAIINVGWDPSCEQDFATNIGKIVYRKSFLLRDADSCLVEYRIKCQIVDPGDYVNNRNVYVWILVGGNLDVASARTFSFTTYYNLSFSADAV